ncbi:alpha/beta hydrolase fold domain-containing protein [Agrobacterium sp.]|jgi:acetyl esterase/lipase|uniref:alpha/beta hydrolase fold domain-containing protein n=1 Tax=Agrobacterium sp. TaxID=361 RepID=UPI0028AA75A6|nr:alpha/beta hydrolase fold domain-containing protein [Agrobacterium sp.]
MNFLHRLAALALVAVTTTAIPSFAQKMAKPTSDMQAVLDKLGALDAKPFSTLTVPEARTKASPADAAKAVQWDKRLSSNPEAQVTTKDITSPSLAGGVGARVYIPGAAGPLPVVVYYHGGGWVVADINVYDAAPQALAVGPNAAVVSVEFRHAPEQKFPAPRDDAWKAYKWLVANIHELNRNADRTAVAGESAGGNLVANVALMAKDQKTKPPVGDREHHYHFQVFALDIETLDLDPGAKRDAVLKAMEGHVLAKGQIVGTFERKTAAK